MAIGDSKTGVLVNFAQDTWQNIQPAAGEVWLIKSLHVAGGDYPASTEVEIYDGTNSKDIESYLGGTQPVDTDVNIFVDNTTYIRIRSTAASPNISAAYSAIQIK